ncbi:MAG: hypothetical protein JSV86_10945 [Gemmatimonadota bacterium]|nr:MAG: hypothetical protein JSV86_10945 [Gemmatimonadota bacterium]
MAFNSNRDGNWEIYIINVRSRDNVRLGSDV